MKLKICFMGLLCLCFSADAQNKIGTSPLKIGDKIPDVVLTNILNNSSKTLRLADYKGKLILVDFWETHCGNCVKAIPQLDSLQRKFSKNVQIILVDPYQAEPEREVKLLIARIKEWSNDNLKLPVVYQDTAISKYIAFQTLTTCAWISPDGRLIAVTDDDQVTPGNIKKALKGESENLICKERYKTDLKPKT